MNTVYIVLIIAAAMVVLVVAWIYRKRLTEGFFKGGKEGIEASIKAGTPREQESTEPPQPGTQESAGVHLSGDYRRAKIKGIAGRDIVKGTSRTRGGHTPGVQIEEGGFSDAELRDIAGRDLIEPNQDDSSQD